MKTVRSHKQEEEMLGSNNPLPGAVVIEGHVQGLANMRALAERGIPVIVVDCVRGIATYSKYCRAYFKCPPFESDEFIEFLIGLCDSESLDGWVLYPSNDHAVCSLARNRSRILERYRALILPLERFQKIYDKVGLMGVARDANVPFPRTEVFEEYGPHSKVDLRFPVLTKGRNGLSFYYATGKKAIRSTTTEELAHNLDLIREIVPLDSTYTQEEIPNSKENKTLSFTAFCVDGKIMTHWIGKKLREHPFLFGTATLAESVYENELKLQSERLLEALCFTGICEIEYLFDPHAREYKLIEVNARTWLWVSLARACGVDYSSLLYDYLNGNNIEWPMDYRDGFVWVNPITDAIYGAWGVMTRHYTVQSLLSPFIGKKVINDLLVFNDIKPGLRYVLNSVSFLKNR